MIFRVYWFWLWVVLAVFPYSSSVASDIKLQGGQLYKGVTILHKDDTILEIQTQYGKLSIPIKTVESIDHVPLWATPTPAPTTASTPTASAPIASSPSAPPAVLFGMTPPPLAATPNPSAAAGATPVPNGSATPAPSATPAAPEWPVYEHNWTMEGILAAFAVFSAIWIFTVGSVQRDLYERRVDPRFWSNLAVALPGAGALFYFISRSLSRTQERKAAARNTNQVVADRERKRTKSAARSRRGFEFLDEDRKAVFVKNQGEVSGIDNARDVLEEALLERASDVHIEPSENEYGVRFRIDGIMHPRMNFDRNDGLRLASALKTLAQIDVAEKRKAQDGRFRVRTSESEIDFRVATANSIFGEKIVIRILDRKSGLLSLSDLGMPQAMMEQFERVIHSRNGMILATGPTGSGKTSTLYSALSQLDSKRLNIMTIEDPVEYELGGATQIPVNVKAGITYESGLRSLLRQDPDVIFVGEMRDIEAAQIALRAALTGHLVFSSLHTRDAIGTIIRLEEMGIERHLIASSMLVLIAQRLVRVLCPACREPYPSAAGELAEIGIELPAGKTIFRAKGCDQCGETGYLGRTGIFEMIVFDDTLRQAVNSGIGEAELAQTARTAGFSSFRENGAEKILQGITSVEEVLQAS